MTITDAQLKVWKEMAVEYRYASLWIDDGWALPAESVLALIMHIETLLARLAEAEAELAERNEKRGYE